MEESGSNQIDSTLRKMILNSVQEGDLSKIQLNLEKYNLDITALKDVQKRQNAFFSAFIFDIGLFAPFLSNKSQIS